MTKCPNAHTLTFNLTTEQYTTHVSKKHVAKSIKINERYMSLTIVVSYEGIGKVKRAFNVCTKSLNISDGFHRHRFYDIGADPTA